MGYLFPQEFYDHRIAGHWEMPTAATWYQRTVGSVWVSITFHYGDTLRLFLESSCKCFVADWLFYFVLNYPSFALIPSMYQFNEHTCYIQEISDITSV